MDLAAREGVAPPSMNRTLGPLHADGLIAKEPDPRDRRSAWITLTEHGRTTIAQIRAKRSQLLADRMARLSAEQTATLLAAPGPRTPRRGAPDGG
ncbi:MarR family transcriptional regulator [Kitasatospora aburaviensis]